MSRAATEMNDPAEVDRTIAEQQKAAEAESKLNEATGFQHTHVLTPKNLKSETL